MHNSNTPNYWLALFVVTSFAFYNDEHHPSQDVPDLDRELRHYEHLPAYELDDDEEDHLRSLSEQRDVPPGLRTRRALELYYDKDEDLLPPLGLNYRW
jgi:hypothetical protein